MTRYVEVVLPEPKQWWKPGDHDAVLHISQLQTDYVRTAIYGDEPLDFEYGIQSDGGGISIVRPGYWIVYRGYQYTALHPRHFAALYVAIEDNASIDNKREP